MTTEMTAIEKALLFWRSNARIASETWLKGGAFGDCAVLFDALADKGEFR